MNKIKMLKYIYPIASSLLALWLVNVFNIIKYFDFVPSEHRFDVCLALYLTIMQVLFAFIDDYLKNKLISMSSKIRFIFYDKENNKRIDSNPIISFNEEQGVAEVKCSLDASGNSTLLRNIELVIQFPQWIQVQPNAKQCKLEQLQDTSLVHIYLRDFLNNSKTDTFSTEFQLPMAMNERNVRVENQIKCECKFIEDKLKYKFYPKEYNSNICKIKNS